MKKPLAACLTLSGLLAPSAAGAANIAYVATLNGAQENPPVTTTNAGTATLNFNDANNKLTGTVTLTGLAAGNVTGQHIHTAACGANGAVAQSLATPSGSTISVDLTLTTQQATDLAAKNLYINIHTTAFAGGEIRGQIFPQGGADACPAGAGDAGADGGDAGTSSSSSSSSSTSSGGSSGTTSSTSSGGSNGATTERVDGGDQPAESGDDGGCSTTGGTPGSGLGLFVAIGAVIALATRNRKKKG
jgi:MYXO-CTERM domain-containing protein